MIDERPFPPQLPSVLTIGVFDGVHRGHQDLVQHMLADARGRSARAVCVTFDPDPALVVRPEIPVRALCSLEKRQEMLMALGVDEVYVVPFSKDVSHLSATDFVEELRSRWDVQSVWVGSDFAMGHGRSGNVETLREIGQRCNFDVNAVESFEYQGRRISSSWIREALGEGDVELVAQLLGRPFCLNGEVVTGMQRGRQLGFPTANVVPPSGRALPADGVYFVQVQIQGDAESAQQKRKVPGDGEQGMSIEGDGWLYGVVNLGPRPTFDESERLIETHLLDFSGDLYGAHMEVCFLQQLRGIRKFESFEALREQIDRDVATGRTLMQAAQLDT
jgi:riboflavin kinase / FMN adenylyltransferase